MQILAHRGVWDTPEEKNTRAALNRAFELGFGTETDVRDLNGQLVISHDMPTTGALPLETVLNDYKYAHQPGMLALNLKSDGLAINLKALLTKYDIHRYFCFDMSIPDTLACLRGGLVVAARISEYEPEGPLSAQSPVIWLDGFETNQLNVAQLNDWLTCGKTVCLVSPELHGRSASDFINEISTLPDSIRNHPALMLCTDYPVNIQRKMV